MRRKSVFGIVFALILGVTACSDGEIYKYVVDNVQPEPLPTLETNVQDIATPPVSQHMNTEFITLENGVLADSRISDELIFLVVRHFEAIEYGDLATFRTALSADDAQDVYRNMNIIGRYFGDLIGIDSEVISNAITTGEGLSEIYQALFESELALERRNLGLSIEEIRLHPYMSDWMLEAVVLNSEQSKSIYQIQFSEGENGWEIGITNALGWLENANPTMIATTSWQEAFAEKLRFYENLPLRDWENGWMFALHDINRDGIPELFLAMKQITGHVYYRYVYAFTNGELVSLEFEGFMTDGAIFAPIDNSPWIFAFLAAGSGGHYIKLEITGNELLPTLEAMAFMSETGHEMMMEYENFDWRNYKWYDLTISGNEATAEEFERIFAAHDDRHWLHFTI